MVKRNSFNGASKSSLRVFVLLLIVLSVISNAAFANVKKNGAVLGLALGQTLDEIELSDDWKAERPSIGNDRYSLKRLKSGGFGCFEFRISDEVCIPDVIAEVFVSSGKVWKFTLVGVTTQWNMESKAFCRMVEMGLGFIRNGLIKKYGKTQSDNYRNANFKKIFSSNESLKQMLLAIEANEDGMGVIVATWSLGGEKVAMLSLNASGEDPNLVPLIVITVVDVKTGIRLLNEQSRAAPEL